MHLLLGGLSDVVSAVSIGHLKETDNSYGGVNEEVQANSADYPSLKKHTMSRRKTINGSTIQQLIAGTELLRRDTSGPANSNAVAENAHHAASNALVTFNSQNEDLSAIKQHIENLSIMDGHQLALGVKDHDDASPEVKLSAKSVLDSFSDALDLDNIQDSELVSMLPVSIIGKLLKPGQMSTKVKVG